VTYNLFILFIYFPPKYTKSTYKKRKKKQSNNKIFKKKNTKTRWIEYAQGVKTTQNINVRHLCRTYTILYKKIQHELAIVINIIPN
jgi:ribosomal protein L16/L10AE